MYIKIYLENKYLKREGKSGTETGNVVPPFENKSAISSSFPHPGDKEGKGTKKAAHSLDQRPGDDDVVDGDDAAAAGGTRTTTELVPSV